MKRIFVSLLLLFLSAQASAGEMAWVGTLEVEFGGLGRLVSTGTGVAEVDYGPPLKSLRISGNLSASGIIPLTDPAVTGTTKSIRYSAHVRTGTLGDFAPSATPQLTKNTLAMGGAVRLCLFISNCSINIPVPFVTSKGNEGVGIGGDWTVGGYGSGFRVSIESAPWTILTASLQVTIPTTPTGTKSKVTTAYTSGFVHGMDSWAGSAAGNCVGEDCGELQLVVPVRIEGSVNTVAFSRLTLRFVPEPGLLLLLGAGVVGLAVLSWAKGDSNNTEDPR